MTSTTWEILIGVLGVLLLVAMVLAYRLMRETPQPRIRRYRVGVFVERDRLPDLDERWSDPEATAEYPPPRP